VHNLIFIWVIKASYPGRHGSILAWTIWKFVFADLRIMVYLRSCENKFQPQSKETNKLLQLFEKCVLKQQQLIMIVIKEIYIVKLNHTFFSYLTRPVLFFTSYFALKSSYSKSLASGGSTHGRRQRGAGVPHPPWIFIHGTNIVDWGLKVLFLGLFFRCPSPPGGG